jgi:glycyl-tRNA synthetase (class II)
MMGDGTFVFCDVAVRLAGLWRRRDPARGCAIHAVNRHARVTLAVLAARSRIAHDVQSYFPHVIEPALGASRLLLAVLADGLREEQATGTSHNDSRFHSCGYLLPSYFSSFLLVRHGYMFVGVTASMQRPSYMKSRGCWTGQEEARLVFRVKDDLAPYSVAVLPLLKKEPQVALAAELQARLLAADVATDFDTTASIGKRYRRQDEIGTPLCITIDPRSVTDGTVTLRCRDSMRQIRLHMDEVAARASRRELTRTALAHAFAAASKAASSGSAAAAARAPPEAVGESG